MKVVYFGMRGQFSRIPFEHLLEADIDIEAVVVPGAGSGPPVCELTPPPSQSELALQTRFLMPTVVQRAWERGIPVFEVGGLTAPAVYEVLAGYEPAAICVACFDRRIPTALRSLPRYGCLNVHPSLLPAHRGPAPLFWAVRAGERETGVTIHFVDAGLDSGDILLQASIAIPDGIFGHELEARCAARGGELLVAALHALEAGTATPRPQPEAPASYEPWPSADDFHISTDRSARWAFNFIRGVDHWDIVPVLLVAGREVQICEAISFDPQAVLGRLWRREGGRLWVQCRPGVLEVRIKKR